MAEALGEMGARIAISARKKDELDQAVSHLKKMGIEAEAFVCDIGKREQVAPLADAVLKKLGKVDILVNNAGATWGSPAEDHPPEACAKQANVNLTAPLLLSHPISNRSTI